jgi:phage RecT family recombinase
MTGVVAIREEVLRGFERLRPNLSAVLPSGISVERFERVALTAITSNPDLMNADRRTLFLACQKCAQDGLLPDGREAVLVVYKTKVKRQGGGEDWIAAVQYQPMVGGIIKKVRQSGEVAGLRGRAVYAKDTFSYQYGDDEKIEHVPARGADRGDITAAYAIATLRDGTIEREVVERVDIDKARATSKAPDSPAWTKWLDQMAIKVALRRLSKRLPISAENLRAINAEDEPDVAELPPLPERPKLDDFSELDAKAAAANLDEEFRDTVGKTPQNDGGSAPLPSTNASEPGPGPSLPVQVGSAPPSPEPPKPEPPTDAFGLKSLPPTNASEPGPPVSWKVAEPKFHGPASMAAYKESLLRMLAKVSTKAELTEFVQANVVGVSKLHRANASLATEYSEAVEHKHKGLKS